MKNLERARTSIHRTSTNNLFTIKLGKNKTNQQLSNAEQIAILAEK